MLGPFDADILEHSTSMHNTVKRNFSNLDVYIRSYALSELWKQVSIVIACSYKMNTLIRNLYMQATQLLFSQSL